MSDTKNIRSLNLDAEEHGEGKGVWMSNLKKEIISPVFKIIV